MKHIIFKKAFVAASALTILGYVGGASAHDISGALGKSPTATDYYQLSCYDDGNGPADHLSIQVIDMAPVAKPLISVQVTKGILAGNTTDAVDGNATYSPALKMKGGDGDYAVTVDKTAAGLETYSLQYHCETSTGDHTGTGYAILANQ